MRIELNAYLMGLDSFAYLMSLCPMQTWQHSPCMGVADEAADDDYRCHECDPAKPKLKVSHILVGRRVLFVRELLCTARGKMWAAHSGTYCIESEIEMPPTFCRVQYFSTFLYGNGNIATVKR
jgi:hypothetical protein